MVHFITAFDVTQYHAELNINRNSNKKKRNFRS